MLIVTGYLYVAPAELARFMTHLKVLAAITRRRDGNISYDAAVDDADAGRLIVSERWVDQAALTAHLNADKTVQFVHQWSGRMRADIRKYDALNERGLSED
ncbi:MAG: antibiotic biosynthesis monooxygenase [Gammaproteobacteria bacterium]|uniref:Antibiotic biosynthesis monooxygenase n=1 Tax=Vreelandella titanicae TaxID=664683 RepID=A0A558JAN6_9GAMM|nr:antibiotic biosynthesis monooxygenase [Halomonas titanicae]MBR9906378.1 antibiotic biosynthesis monooxygenase [Gammaproteobacteria bacterium]TVU90683.1 antibiotic biosynthesis monooxygenase [Halomonas titanicae]